MPDVIEYDVDFKENPEFNTVLNLSNRTFDPENFVSGRGATEDQLKFLHDLIEEIEQFIDDQQCTDDPYTLILQRLDELEAKQAVCCDNPQSGIIQAYNDRLDELEERQIACCNNEGATINDIFNQIQSRIAQLETRINSCCERIMVGNEAPVPNSQYNATGGFALTWDSSTLTGQIVYTKQNAGDAVSYFFLTEMTNGLYYAKGKYVAAGKGIVSLDVDTGALTYVPDVYDDLRGRRSVVVGVVDDAGNQLLGIIDLPEALWQT